MQRDKRTLSNMSFIQFVNCSWRTKRGRKRENENFFLSCISPWAPSTHALLHFKLMITLLPYSLCSYSECLYQFICHSSYSNNMACWYTSTKKCSFFIGIAKNHVFLCTLVFECVSRQQGSGVEGGHETFFFSHYINYVAQRVRLLAEVQHSLHKQCSGNYQYFKIYGAGNSVNILEEIFQHFFSQVN